LANPLKEDPDPITLKGLLLTLLMKNLERNLVSFVPAVAITVLSFVSTVIFVATFMLALVLRAFGFSSGESRLLESRRNRVLEERECRIIWEIGLVGTGILRFCHFMDIG
jgi:hypothetical protein